MNRARCQDIISNASTNVPHSMNEYDVSNDKSTPIIGLRSFVNTNRSNEHISTAISLASLPAMESVS